MFVEWEYHTCGPEINIKWEEVLERVGKEDQEFKGKGKRKKGAHW